MQSAKKPAEVSESRFYMWRTLFALAHTDNRLALDEQGLLYRYLDEVPFSKQQLAALRDDVAAAQNVEEMFKRVTAQADRDAFFELAREVVWSDGVLDEREKELMDRLGAVRDFKSGGNGGGFLQNLIGKITGKKGNA